MISKLILSDNARLVFAYINEHGPVSAREISLAICRSMSVVRLSTQRLRKYGYITYGGNRKWVMTFAGRMAAMD
jgi:Mn-dependent DtxR family transcriptional regulator